MPQSCHKFYLGGLNWEKKKYPNKPFEAHLGTFNSLFVISYINYSCYKTFQVKTFFSVISKK